MPFSSYNFTQVSSAPPHLVFFAAVIRVVTQRSSPLSGGEALRDDPNNGCEGDYATLRPRDLKTEVSLWKRIRFFSGHTRRRNLKTQQLIAILDYRAVIVCEKLHV